MKSGKESVVKKMKKCRMNDVIKLHNLLYDYLVSGYDLKYLIENSNNVMIEGLKSAFYDLDLFSLLHNKYNIQKLAPLHPKLDSVLLDLVSFSFNRGYIQYSKNIIKEYRLDCHGLSKYTAFSTDDLIDIYISNNDIWVVNAILVRGLESIKKLYKIKDKLPEKYSIKVLEKLYMYDLSTDNIVKLDKKDITWFVRKIIQENNLEKAYELFPLLQGKDRGNMYDYIIRNDDGKYTYFLLKREDIKGAERKFLEQNIKTCDNLKYRFLWLFENKKEELKKIFVSYVAMEAFLHKHLDGVRDEKERKEIERVLREIEKDVLKEVNSYEDSLKGVNLGASTPKKEKKDSVKSNK